MSEKSAPISLGYGTEAWNEYTAAQQEAKDILAQRQNRLIDPTYLAMAQGFLAPTKTGSFGESLGNVAAAAGQAQSAEEKRAMDMAKMRMELAQQGLQTSIQVENAKADQELLARMTGKPPTPVAAPQAAPVAQPAQGAQPQTAPTTGLPSAPVSGPAPVSPLSAPVAAQPAPVAQSAQPAQAPQAPQGLQLYPPEPETWTPQEAAFAMAEKRRGQGLGQIMADIQKQRQENMVVKEGMVVNRATGQTYIPPSGKEAVVRLPGETSPFKTTEALANKLAYHQVNNQPDEYWKTVEMIKNGMPPPKPQAPANTPTGVAPANAPAQTAASRTSAMPSVAQEEAAITAAKSEAEKAGTGRGARTSTAMDKVEPAIEVRAVAQSAKDLVNQEGGDLVLGIFEKPTVRSALAKMIDEGKFTPIGFRDAMVAAKVAFNVPQKPDESGKEYEQRKQDILDRYYQAGTQAARAKFEASTLAKGQGAFSDGERRLFADTTISTKMSRNTFNKTSDMLIARANFAESIANAIEDNNTSYDKFRRTPEYQKMLKNYESQLSSIWTGKPASSGTTGKPNLDAARQAVEREIR